MMKHFYESDTSYVMSPKHYVLTQEAKNYSNIIYRMNIILGKLWSKYLHIPMDYACFPFFKTQYYRNLEMSDDYFQHAFLSSEYPQVNLGDMKLLANRTNRVLVPLEFVDINLTNFDTSSENAKIICEKVQKFNNLLKSTFSDEKIYVMCHYKYINQFQVIDKNGYDQIYWPQSLHEQKDMFEFSIVNNRNMYNMIINMQKYYDDFFELMSSASIDIIEKIKENIIALNDKIDDNQFAQWYGRLRDIWKYNTPCFYVPDYSEARTISPLAMNAMITNGCANPSEPDFGLIGVKYIVKPKPFPYEEVEYKYNSNEQRKKLFPMN